MHYRAFISYSHADQKWASWLMRRLESYRVPANLVGTKGRDGPIPAKLGKFFRDRDELPSAGNLSKTINDALEKSHALIVICSPTSAKSQWVNAEIDAFREKGNEDNILSFIVDGDPASREPGIASFPYALIKPESEGAPDREPLAADARKQGDGRERAFIKLVAGLLGVGFDDLAQREAQQRHKRMAIITGASLLGMTLAVVLAVTAYIARNDAERRQAQAEDILGFMLGDLRKNLTKVGRLDLMRSVDDKATGYFATLNPRDLSDRALEEQARSLYGIGEVRVNEGKNDEAMAAFRESHARSTALYERAPKNGQRLFDLAQAEYWIGFVAWQQGNFEDTALWLGKYRDSGIKLAAMDRSNFNWQKEAAYGYHNMAVLDESLGKYDQAEKAMLAERKLYVEWQKQYPKDVELRFEAANIDSWLGSLALQQGKLQKAEVYFTEENKALITNIAQDPNNSKWDQEFLESLHLLLDSQVKIGKLQNAIDLNAKAITVAKKLINQDSKNNGWLLSLGKSSYWDAALDSLSRKDLAANATAVLYKAHAVEPKNQDIIRWLVRSLVLQAQLELSTDIDAQSLSYILQAKKLVEPFWKNEPNEKMRLSMANVLICEGEIFLRLGRRSEAELALNKAVVLLSEDMVKELPFAALDDLVRALHLQGEKVKAASHRARLSAAGFVPLRPYP